MMKSKIVFLLSVVLFAGCATKPYDYSKFRSHRPKSILVLPPLNQSTDIKGTYSCLSSITEPLAEHGYYVFPVSVIDEMMKENGLPTAGEMHQASLKKIREVVNPDAVMYITLERYGSKFQVVDSNSTVTASARLVHTKTGELLWAGKTSASQSANAGSQQGILGMIVTAAVAQAVNSSVDRSHAICRDVNRKMISTQNHGLLLGPRHRAFPKDFP